MMRDDVFYQDDAEREALVTLDDEQIDLARLATLPSTGLAIAYHVPGGD